MSNATAAKGTLIKVGDAASPEIFTTIAEVTNIGGPELEQEAIDVSHHGLAWKEFVGGLKDGGEISIEANYLPADATHDASTGILADLAAGTLRNFELVFTDTASTTWSFTALITRFAVGAPVDNKLSVNITLKLSGEPTLA